MSDTKSVFIKPPLSASEHIALLRSRGMEIADEETARLYLVFIGYYRLSGYVRWFREAAESGNEQLKSGTTLEQVIDLYAFDRKLRVLLLDALERIEVAIKATLSNAGAQSGGPFWLSHPENFDCGAFDKITAEIEEVIRKKKEHHQPFISYFYNKYSDPVPPCWMLMELLSFGAVSRIYKATRGSIRIPVATEFKIQQDVLASWLHCLAFARNFCAHNCRVWNRLLTIRPQVPRHLICSVPAASRTRIYMVCCIIQHMMKVIADGSLWADRLRTLIAERPDVPLSSLGFPDSWESLSPWTFGQG